MTDAFFYQEKGKVIGPLSLSDAKAKVRDGRIRLFDLVMKDGDPQWRLALEFPELRGEFKSSAVKEMKERPWVVLQRKNPESMDFVTSGPFAPEEIQSAIQGGKILYSDYVWRDGFAEWKRINTLEIFNRRAAKTRDVSAPSPPEPSGEELLKNVVEVKRPKVPLPAPPPPEAKIGSAPAAPPALEVSTAGSEPAAEMERPISPAVTHAKRRGILTDWTVVGALALLFASFVFVGWRYLVARNVVEEPFTDEAPAVAEAPEVKAPLAVAPTVANPAEKPNAPAEPPAPPKKSAPPTELVLNVQNVSGTQVSIEVRTDAGPDFPVTVQIVGQPGFVSEGAAFYRLMKITPKGEGLKPVDLSGMKLPQGRFILRVETGSLKKEARMAVGVTEAPFKQAVARLRKQHAHAIWRERLQLLRLSEELEGRLAEAIAGKKFSSKGLEALQAVTRANGADFLLFDNWWEMKEIVAGAKTLPTLALMARLKKAREALRTFSVWK